MSRNMWHVGNIEFRSRNEACRVLGMKAVFEDLERKEVKMTRKNDNNGTRIILGKPVTQAYYGKAHTCCCGCAGTHYVQDNPMGKKRNKERGSTINNEKFNMICDFVEKAVANNEIEFNQDTCVSALSDNNKRVYIVYFD